ncbi:YfiR family protein [bacterium]|nr:YfiR family protein [bacterium]
MDPRPALPLTPSRPAGWRVAVMVALLAALTALAGASGRAHAAPPEEYALKAALVRSFLTFTDWPAEVGGPLTFCVYGPDPFGAHLDRMAGASLGGRVLAARRIVSVDDMAPCQAVFITQSLIGNLPRVLDAQGNRPMLLLADSPGATRMGVGINIVETEQGKMGFDVNLGAIRRQGLNLNFKVLRLAREVSK